MKRVSTQLRAGLLSFALLAVAAPAAQAGLAWSPSPHNYGSVTPGASGSQVFTLTATCDVPASVPALCDPFDFNHTYGTITVTGAGFTLGNNTCTTVFLMTVLFPGPVSCTSTVSFTPPGAGAFTGSLNTSEPGAPDVALSGTGASPAAPTVPTAQTPAAGGVPAKKKCKKKKRAAAAAKRCKKKRK